MIDLAPVREAYEAGDHAEVGRIVGAALREWPEAVLVSPGDLLSTKDVAELLGVDRTTASRWLTQGYLPEPFGRPASGPIWLRPVIEAFAEQHHARADAAGRRPVGSNRVALT